MIECLKCRRFKFKLFEQFKLFEIDNNRLNSRNGVIYYVCNYCMVYKFTRVMDEYSFDHRIYTGTNVLCRNDNDKIIDV